MGGGAPKVSRPTVLAAGGVLWRRDAVNPEVALVHRPKYDDWSLPKGKAKPGEHLLVTALREVTEETGYCPRIGPHLTSVRYRITSGSRVSNKVVTYWAMRCAGGSFLASREVDEMQWLPLDEAAWRLSSASDRFVLRTFERTRRDTRRRPWSRSWPGSGSPTCSAPTCPPASTRSLPSQRQLG